MVHSSSFLYAYKDETAFCSGGGAVANTPTELVFANLTALDRCKSFVAGIPKPKRVDEFHLASALTPDLTMLEHIGVGEGSLQSYLQTNVFYNWAISPTLGGTGTSKAFRYTDGDAEKDLYGGLVKKWVGTIDLGKPIFQDVEFFFTQSKTASCTNIDPAIPAFSSATPQVWSGKTLTFDTHLITALNLRKVVFTLENTWNLEKAYTLGSVYCVAPTLDEQTITVDIEYLSLDTNTWLADEMNQTAQLIGATIGWGLFTHTLANYTVWKTNTSEISERGIITRTAQFKRGVGGTQAVA